MPHPSIAENLTAPMRIATFNLEDFSSDARGAAPLQDRIAMLRPQLQRLKADILCLQEVNAERKAKSDPRGYHSMRRLLEGTAYGDYSWASTTVGSSGQFADKHNLLTYSRHPIRLSAQFSNMLVPPVRHCPVTASPEAETEMELTWDRPLLYCQIEVPGNETLHVINLHLRAPLAVPIAGRKAGQFQWTSVSAWAEGFHLAAVKRSGQALETRLVIDRIFDDDPAALIMVCGDFNAQSSETAVRIVRGDQEDTGNGALAARAMVPLERTVPPSQRYSVVHAGRHQMLDHMLASRALLARSRGLEIHNEALEDELVAFAIGGRNPASFHAPVVASFDLG